MIERTRKRTKRTKYGMAKELGIPLSSYRNVRLDPGDFMREFISFVHSKSKKRLSS